jgi:PAS domain S-box-containing protein
MGSSPVVSSPSDSDVVQQALADGELNKALLDQFDTGIYIVDSSRRILYWNGGAERITGYLTHEVAGQLCHGDLFMHCDADGDVLSGPNCPLPLALGELKPVECTVVLRHRQGHLLPVKVRSTPIHDGHGNVTGAMVLFEESHASARNAIRELRPFGCLDELTGAAGRRYGEMRVRHALEALDRFRLPFGWMRIGLDDTERLELRYGHGMIDAAMKVLSGTLDGNLGPLDVLTRWAKAEFRVEVHPNSRVELNEVADRLVMLIRASGLEWWGDRVHATVSIAGATAGFGDTLESLEARVAEVFEGCQAAGGDLAAVAQPVRAEGLACSP